MGSAAPSAEELLADVRRAALRKIDAELARERATAAALRGQVLPALRRAIAEARRRGLCESARLIGSYAWGRPDARSDLDLLARTEDPLALAVFVGKRCGLDVHVLTPEKAPAALRERAAREGVALEGADDDVR